ALAGNAAFFLSTRLAPRAWLWAGAGLLVGLAALLWFQVETGAGGWRGPWEQHPARLLGALSLLAPPAAIYGAVSPAWWAGHVSAPYGLPPGWETGLVYGALLVLASLGSARVCRAGFRRLA